MEQAANGTSQRDSEKADHRCERSYARPRLRLRSHTLTSVRDRHQLMPAPLSNERKGGLAGMQMDKAPVEWP